MRLRVRLLLAFVPAVILVMTLFGAWQLREGVTRIDQELQGQTLSYARALALAFAETELNRIDSTGAQRLVDRVSADVRVFGVIVYDVTGTVRYASTSLQPFIAPQDSSVRAFIARRVREEEIVRQLGPARTAAFRRLIEGRRNRIIGALEVVQPRGLVDATVAETRRQVLIGTAVLLGVIALLLVVLARQLVVAPLTRLSEGVRALGSGDTTVRVPARYGTTEFDDVATAFNEMASRLGEARDALLREADERVSLQQRLGEAERRAAAGTIAAGLAHDIGAPLNVISARAEMLLRRTDLDDAARRHLSSIVEQANRITKAVRTLLDDARRANRRTQVVAIEQVVDAALETVELPRQRAGVLIECVRQPLPAVIGDPDQLRQVLVNLLLNGIEALEQTVPPRRLELSFATSPGDVVRVIVQDSGRGIDPAIAARLFSPFTTTKPSGTGLGLVVSRRIAEEHGGALVLDARPDGAPGARFVLTVPAADTTALAAS
ncbi:MAG: ATP-binding protein [Gemmatimonadaceae bacterium]|jgi:signal transduction histidine kinase|nr:ATP-binding protein [Gemmatimonadaceae bacterium]